MLTFTYNKKSSAPAKAITAEEEEIVNKQLKMFTTKKQAIMYLVKREWSTKQIQQKIRYDDGRELLPQHINQVKQQMKK